VGEPTTVGTPDICGDSVSLPNHPVDAQGLKQALAFSH
jgi:hypothetical protein